MRTYKVERFVLLRKGPGTEYDENGHLDRGRRVTSFVTEGAWIRINCELHAVDCGARWVAVRRVGRDGSSKHDLSIDTMAPHKCVFKGCKNDSSFKYEDKIYWRAPILRSFYTLKANERFGYG